MKIYLSVAILLIIGCGHELDTNDESIMYENNSDILSDASTKKDLGQEFSLTSIWVCNHPGTKQHNTVCVEDQYPRGCYVKGDNGKFCWLLTASDCLETREEEGWVSLCGLMENAQ